MGKTHPTFRELLKQFKNRWKPFRKALRSQDQEYFDKVFEKAENKAHAGSVMAADQPGQSFFLSVLVEQEKEIQKLKEKIEQLD